MREAGLTTEQMNEALATAIIPKAEEWREAMLNKIMRTMSEANAPDSVCDEPTKDMPNFSIN